MTEKSFNIFNYASLAVVALLVVLMLTDAVPHESYIYLLVFALVLLVVRIILRIIFIRKNNKQQQGG